MLNSLLVFTKLEPGVYIIAKNVYNAINYHHLLHSATYSSEAYMETFAGNAYMETFATYSSK